MVSLKACSRGPHGDDDIPSIVHVVSVKVMKMGQVKLTEFKL